MTTFLVAVLGGVLAGPAGDARLADGIYFVSQSEEGTAVEREDGSRVFLAGLATKGFGKASLTSTANDNSVYRLDLEGAGPFPAGADRRHLAVYLDGVYAGVVSHTDPSPQRTMDLIAYAAGEEAARKMAKPLGIAPRSRRHPGHLLAVRWQALKPSYLPGEPVMLRLGLTNVGEKTIRFVEGGRQRGARDNQFAFIAHRNGGWGRAVPDTGSPEHHGGKGSFRTLPPGGTFTKEVDVTKWFKFEERDSCRITCLYQIELEEPGVKYAVWDEYCVGQCLVGIRAPAAKREP